ELPADPGLRIRRRFLPSLKPPPLDLQHGMLPAHTSRYVRAKSSCSRAELADAAKQTQREENQTMNEWRLNHGSRRRHGVRAALAGAVASICALVASPAPVLAEQNIQFFTCTAQSIGVLATGGSINVVCLNDRHGFFLTNGTVIT